MWITVMYEFVNDWETVETSMTNSFHVLKQTYFKFFYMIACGFSHVLPDCTKHCIVMSKIKKWLKYI